MSRAARPYAEALFAIAAERGDREVAEWDERLSATVARLEASGLWQAAKNPTLPKDVRRAVLLRAAGENVPKEIASFLLLLVERRRVAELPEIARRFHELRRRRSGEVEAVVETAIPPDARLREELERAAVRLAGGEGRPLRLEVRHVPELVGGVRLAIGDRVYDASVAGRLERLRGAVSRG
ncbi:MAG: ATP synthase F1 subunit delta [Clostridia bacterium]|nr:ATP synthase F1 subunit delta [Clostridia bacterium]